MKMINKNYLKLVQALFISYILILPNVSIGQKVAQAGMQYLKIGVGAEMAGRGEAGIASVNDISAIFWNPGGLALMEGSQFLLSHNHWIADISQNVLAFGMNLGSFGTIGASFIYMDYGKFYPTVRDPEDYGLAIDDGFLDPKVASSRGIYLDSNLDPVDLAFGVAYARKFTDKFWMGGQLKLLYQNLGKNLIQRVDAKGNALGAQEVVESELTTFALDFGTVYKPGFAGISFSVVFQHFGPENKYQVEEFPLPYTFRMGISLEMKELFINNASPHDLLLCIDTVKPNDYDQRLHIGTEYNFKKIFFLRAGYKWNYDIESLSAGLGILYRIANIKWKIDVSYTKFKWFNSPMRYSIGGQF